MPSVDYDKIVSDYTRHRQVDPEVLKHLVSTGNPGRNSKVLEVGCGTGNYILALKRLVGSHCWGIDPAQGMLAKTGARSGGVYFQLGRAEGICLRSDCFDLIFSVDVIHHVEDRSACFQETYRLLRSGGKLCTVTDSEWVIRQRRPLAVYFPETVEPELERYPRISALRGLMEQVGFRLMYEELIAFPYQLTDIRAYRDRAFSALHLISEEAFRRGIERLERDLSAGPIPCISRYVLLWGIK
jgi:ubiquinone/menaquinone biosynthesis C-methylase UbiE